MPHRALPELSLELQELFPRRVRDRGADYFHAGSVEVAEDGPDEVSGEVFGQDAYRVRLRRGPAGWEGVCSCPAFAKLGPCKHLWALVLEVEALGLEIVRWSGITPSRPEEPVPKTPETGGWREELERLALAAGARPRDAWSGLARPARRIEYELDLEATRAGAELVLRSVARQPLEGGGWGKPEAFAPRAWPPVDPVDRQVFAALGERCTSEYDSVSRREIVCWRLDDAQSALLVPLLCASGRFFARPGEPAPLTLDPGEPWRLALELVRDDAAGECVVDGFLERGGERIALAGAVLACAPGWIFSAERAARLDDGGAFPWIAHLRQRGALRAGYDEERELVAALLALPGAPRLHGLALEPAPARGARARLEVLSPSGDSPRCRRFACRIQFDYEGARVDADDPRGHLLSPDGRALARDPRAERAHLADFLEAGGRVEDGSAGVAPAVLPELLRRLLARGWSVEADGRQQRVADGFALSVRSGVDWFDLAGGARFGEELVPLPALLAAAASERHAVELADGALGLLPEGLRDGVRLASLGEARGDVLRFSRAQAWILDALLAARPEVEVDAAFAERRARLERFEGIAAGREPKTFRAELRGYQREGLGWLDFLREVGIGGCLADDMGLGKTVQVLALLEQRRLAGARWPSLVVAPKTLVFNWLREAERFAPELTVLRYSGPARRAHLRDLDRYDLVVTTYGTLRRDSLELAEQHFDYVVLDEAQAIKNSTSQASKAARLLWADQRLALSGTPVENGVGELWSLFEFLNPGMLGRASAFECLVDGGDPGLEEGGRRELGLALRPFFLRRTKEQVLKELPEKVEQVLYCELSAREQRAYDAIRAHYRASLLARADGDGLEGLRLHVLEALLRLRQSACHPALIDDERRGESSAKLETLLPLLADVREGGHKALVFSQFTKLLGLVRAELDARGIPYEYLDGKTRDREAVVDRFQNDASRTVFLISLKVGGVGLNLTAADYVFLLDPWWNPAAERQAVDRAHRMGQTRRVFVYRLISRGTVEEKVLELQARKQELASSLVVSDEGFLRNLTREDLERLLV